MKIMIIGGTGRVGKELVKFLKQDKETELSVTTRSPGKYQNDHIFENVKLVKFNLAELLVSDITELFNGFDVVYFVAGSRNEDLVQTESFGAIKTMQAAEKAGVTKYVMLSSAFALQPDKWINNPHYGNLQAYQAAKYIADYWLIHNTDLDYTILQPSTLTETSGTGKVQFNIETPGENSITDVAEVLKEVINNKNDSNKVITMHSGKSTIQEELNNL
ncbi:NAD(P)H-binding protein [Lactobacillus sp. S2-2]|uniref:NAD(P)-binding oxidoreductase n=1 Tax=Lactobacillus sp. S2-2 TaxID=2692917 RepID=UPI001F2A80F8|nr:NAD(P)-binding oxidoreductase [Lactobacillus sp. S2-2]MCF6515613.1 NAD(P)H-binding protein [Lactobacillus sp. S2-2]